MAGLWHSHLLAELVFIICVAVVSTGSNQMSGGAVGEYLEAGALRLKMVAVCVCVNFCLNPEAATAMLPDELLAALSSIEDASAKETHALELRHKQASKDRAAAARELRLKKKRDDKLLQKSSSKLSGQQLLVAAARKVAKESKAKARASSSGTVA